MRKIKDTRMRVHEHSLQMWDYMNKHKAVVRNANTFKQKTNIIKAQDATYANRMRSP